MAGLSYLSYKGWIDLKWRMENYPEIENVTRTTLTSVVGHMGHVLNNTSSMHSTTIQAAGLPVAVAFVIVCN